MQNLDHGSPREWLPTRLELVPVSTCVSRGRVGHLTLDGV